MGVGRMQEVSVDQHLLDLLNLLDVQDLKEVSVDAHLLDLLQVLVDQHLLDLQHARLQVLPRHLHLGDKVLQGRKWNQNKAMTEDFLSANVLSFGRTFFI